MDGGTVLSAKTSLRFANKAPRLEFDGVTGEFVKRYFGLTDDLELSPVA